MADAKPICAACNHAVEDHYGPVDPDSTYFCTRSACVHNREKLERDIKNVFHDYESDFMDDEERTEAAEAAANSVAAAKAAAAQRGLLVQKSSTLYLKLKREWPIATDEAILSVTIEQAKKAKPPRWADLIRTNQKLEAEPVRDSELRFQVCANDSEKWSVSKPPGTDHISGAPGNASKVIQDFEGSVENWGARLVDTGDVCREDTPEWIRDEKSFDEFFKSREYKGDQISDEDIISSWQVGRELDRCILREYYVGRNSDQQIFETYKSSFDLERQFGSKKVRWTSSPDAVKHRRMRLLREWDALLGKRKKWTDSSWRGIIVSYAAKNSDGQWCRAFGGIGTKQKRKDALIVAEEMGYTGRFAGDLADLVVEDTFNSREALNAWMSERGLRTRDEPAKANLESAEK